VIEGQGAITHPGYSGVTLGLLHGSAPDAMIFCHQAGRECVRHFERFPLPPMKEQIRLYEDLARAVHPARVAGVSLNTFRLTDEEARQAIAKTEQETGLPATDPIRFDAEPLVDALKSELT